MTDDGFNKGVLYKGNRAPFSVAARGAPQRVAGLEKGFQL
jgi:hypothetical protein